MDTLADHAALKFGADLKHKFACRGGGVDRLLIEVQIDPTGLQRPDRASKKRQTTAVNSGILGTAFPEARG
jgi:hypothetical protein